MIVTTHDLHRILAQLNNMGFDASSVHYHLSTNEMFAKFSVMNKPEKAVDYMHLSYHLDECLVERMQAPWIQLVVHSLAHEMKEGGWPTL